ncbi:MAG: RNA methyltransferase RsmF [Muribaculaceae bacterium]|nr:RNA methyltransferase RsmF [Muribaculaceae bacterium]
METPIPSGYREMIQSVFGTDSESLLSSLDTAPGVSIRYNNRKCSAEEVDGIYPDMRVVEWCREGRRLNERPVFTLNPLLHAGVFYVQDASSMIYSEIVELLVSRLHAGEQGMTGRPLRVLDFCAAPGGKTTSMINALPDGTEVVANEYEPRRGKILRENLEKWGYPNIIVTGDAAESYRCLAGVFDIVAVDAPCSGEGMMRKEETARRQWSERLVESCAALQREILESIAGCVRPGGYLIYSTCTFNTVENEENSRYIRDMLGFEPVSLRPDGTECAGKALYDDVEAMRFMPYLTEGEGLYVSVFRRPESDVVERVSAGKSKRAKTKGRESKLPEIEWIIRDAVPVEGEGVISAVPRSMMPLLELVKGSGVNVTAAGLPVATLKDKNVLPDSRVVLSSLVNPTAFPVVELSEDEALRYLRREALVLPEGTPRGYVTVCRQGHPLGLVKNIGNRANNLYPAHWKIRM